MSIVDEVRNDRADLARVLKKHTGIRKMVEELYPDNAHFIYELLQNAEDTGATEVEFTLSNNCLLFEHNGRPFEERDIYGITDIGEGTKGSDENKIGRFGIGFKAVFAYTETPRIWSPTYSFQISELVLPTEIGSPDKSNDKTRFEFPFNNTKKNPDRAFDEICDGLNGIEETALLFLSNIEKISWTINGSSSFCVERIKHSDHHIETVKYHYSNKSIESSHFLRITQPVEGLETQNTAVAFPLDYVPSSNKYDKSKKLSSQFRIIPAKSGNVSVFFVAEKETSGLRFHIHAPFVPELSRASIKETQANTPLFQQIAALVVRSLFIIRDLGMLTGDFLAVLPNPADSIPDRYQCIRDAIVEAMNNHPLTPTYTKSHSPAKQLLQGKASLKALICDEDLAFFFKDEGVKPSWSISATQRNSDIDRFLSSLEIREWGIDHFVEMLQENLDPSERYDLESYELNEGPDQEFINWMRKKTSEWHQKLYALLYQELEEESEFYRVEDSCIVRTLTGEYSVGSSCYFSADDKDNTDFVRVDKAVYTSGKNVKEQERSRRFLESIGVREVGEADLVELILKERYTDDTEIPSNKTYVRDLNRFISLVASEPKKAKLFADYYIFEGLDENWYLPGAIYLDTPYINTGLHAYYAQIDNSKLSRVALSNKYENLEMSVTDLVRFARMVGATDQLTVSETTCQRNPSWSYLRSVSGDRYTSPINQDYIILGLDKLLENTTIELSRLVWNAMSGLPKYPNYLQARYQKNQTNGCRSAPSQLVYLLARTQWVPQHGDVFVKPSEAISNMLPPGFPFDSSYPWIKAVQFGEESAKKNQEEQKRQAIAKELGFDDEQSLARARRFASLPPEEQQRILEVLDRQSIGDLPDREMGDRVLRDARVRDQAEEAPEPQCDERVRSVSTNRENIKKDADPYLCQQYTTTDNSELICQICKSSLPFKMPDGNYYYELVEFLPDLKKRHYQNYLVLCPNHAAMYKHANGAKDILKELFTELTTNELDVVLADNDMSIYFTKTHIADMKIVVGIDSNEEFSG